MMRHYESHFIIFEISITLFKPSDSTILEELSFSSHMELISLWSWGQWYLSLEDVLNFEDEVHELFGFPTVHPMLGFLDFLLLGWLLFLVPTSWESYLGSLDLS